MPRRFIDCNYIQGGMSVYKLSYKICFANGAPIEGAAEVSGGAWRLALDLPEDIIVSAQAQLHVDIAPDEKIFINGYQTWTSCPEQTSRGRLRGVGFPYPRAAIRHYGMDRYGDYHFVPYPNRPGVTHGESWCYFRRGEDFRLIASLDERPGYTLFRFDAGTGTLTVSRDCAGIRCGGEYHVFDLFFASGVEDAVFDAWFDAMGVTPRTSRKLAGYSSWYNRYQDISEDSIRADLTGCAQLMRPGDLFQIDDGWEPFVGDWLETDEKKFPAGLKPLADDIHARGYLAGLWLAPFVCQKGSRIMREHPDWLLLHEGKPWYCGCNWGGFYALDIDNPEFQAYLEAVFTRVLDEWGFDLVKLDFLYAAAPYGDENETRAGRMTRAMELLRRLCGDKLILGCGVPVMPAFGLVDYCRISCDVGLDWDNSLIMRHTNRERVSTRQAIGNSISRRQLNGRAFGNDPDVFFLRESNIRLSETDKYKLAVVNSLFGTLFLTSDNMGEYGNEAAALYERLRTLSERAENIRVDTDNGLTVYYDLEGTEQVLEIE